METLVKEYEPHEPASHHTRSRNTLVFTAVEQLRPEHQDHPARYRFCRQYLSAQDRVFDCASGCGYGSAILAETCASVVGVELHADLVEFARKNWGRPHVEFQQFDISSGPLPFEDNAFTAIVSLETIEHLPNATHALKEFRRVLRPEGLLLISTPQAPMGNPHHVHEFQLGELCLELEKTGFPIFAPFTQNHATDFLPFSAPIAGRQNFVIAGRPSVQPLAAVVDEQYRMLRMLRQQYEQAQSELEKTRLQTQLVYEKGERELAGMVMEMRILQSKIRDLTKMQESNP